MLAASGPSTANPTDPGSVVETPRPYQFPQNAPYNVPTPALVPTPDGTGDCLHPDVWDAGTSGWRGWRFWMAVTPYRIGSDEIENPCILVSNNGYHWRTPTGLTNPIDPWPGQATSAITNYNSDTDLVHDPATDRLVCTYREVDATTGSETIRCRTSPDGITWSAETTLLSFVEPGYGYVSQAVLQAAPNQWRMYFFSGNAGAERLCYFTAPSPTGPWSTTPTTYILTGAANDNYHGDFIKHGSRYYGVFPATSGGITGDAPAVSTDGVTFVVGQPFTSAAGGQRSYRPTMQVDPTNPTQVNVWYSTLGTSGPELNRVYFTRVPLALWDDLIP